MRDRGKQINKYKHRVFFLEREKKREHYGMRGVVCRLFVQPLYCGVFLEQSLILSRRRDDKDREAKTEKVGCRGLSLSLG